jgi:RNA polymerase sigma factor (sigma-70 family)
MRLALSAVEPPAPPHENVGLIGRRAECDALDHLLSGVRAGESRVLVMQGEPGVGKTALLDYVAQQAAGCRVIRASGVESEMELTYAALHQMCAPILNRLDHLPPPQRDALGTSLGLSAGPAPDRLLIGLAVLSMFSDAAEAQPLVCLVDDVQWLDRASAQVLAFVARRLVAESVGLIAASRMPDPDMKMLSTLEVKGLKENDARALLDAALTAPLDERVRDRLIAETRGNPLALLEWPRYLTMQELAGGFGLPGAAHLSAAMEEGYRRSIQPFPSQTRNLLLLAAAEPLGDPALLWRAAARLGIGTDAATPAIEGGVAEFGTLVRFRHPLARSAAYRSAPLRARQQVHRALAEVTDPELDPDRRAWHRAQAAPGPDEDVAAELERSAGRARARGGLAAAAAFHERATMLTVDPAHRAERALTAASAKVDAGAFDSAVDLLATAERGPLNDFQQARVELVRAQLAFATSRGGDAPLLLLRAARRFEPIEPRLARETYLDALSAATFAGRLASSGGSVLEVAWAAAAAPRPAHTPRAPDLLLDGLAANFVDGYPSAVPDLRAALTAFGSGMSIDEELRWMWLINLAALHLWDDEHWDTLSGRYLQLARAAGALNELPLALSTRAMLLMFAGDLTAAGALIDEQHTVTEATGIGLAPYAAMHLAAMRGQQAETIARIEQTSAEGPRRGQGISLAVAEWTRAVLYNGLGNYADAMAAADQALYHQEYPDVRYPGVANWAAAEFIEAAVRSGMSEKAAETTRWITEMTGASGTDWALGVEMRSRALLAGGEAAERLYQESITHLGRSRVRTELARAHLVYGEWLRRQRRRLDARAQLRTAHSMLDAMGMQAFAERAGRELQATGETARKRTAKTSTAELTRPRDTDSSPGPRRAIQPGDRHPPVHQRQDGPVSPAQGLRQARHHLTQPAPIRLALEAWLYRIMQNTWINQYRKKQSRLAEVSVENITDQHAAADVLLASNRLRSAEVDVLESLPDDEIRAALMSLREETRIAVYYADVEGFSYKEIANITNTSVGTVMSRLHRGRQRLRVALRMVASQRGMTSAETWGDRLSATRPIAV